jgi:hypothetical protein
MVPHGEFDSLGALQRGVQFLASYLGPTRERAQLWGLITEEVAYCVA